MGVRGKIFESDMRSFTTPEEHIRWVALKEMRSMVTIRYLLDLRPHQNPYPAQINEMYDTCVGKFRDEWRAKRVEIALSIDG